MWALLFLLGDGGPDDLLRPRDLLPLSATAQLLRKDQKQDPLSCKSFQKRENTSSQKQDLGPSKQEFQHSSREGERL